MFQQEVQISVCDSFFCRGENWVCSAEWYFFEVYLTSSLFLNQVRISIVVNILSTFGSPQNIADFLKDVQQLFRPAVVGLLEFLHPFKYMTKMNKEKNYMEF